ncbi:hypothetical protein [Roseibacillus persicicus]|uniref:Uncharacterized protein n=1 Tax=Roseibacillus persicicus TaxID=454148 RepID=A0A918TNZ2_9BACT|nr:hypothetical protein GCM10007100_24960 [Roseibacillus persicicus]
MEKYKKHIADLPNVEFIHISLENGDDGAEKAEKWAAKESFPWLTVLPEDAEKSGLSAYKTTNSVPEYHLIDGDGNTVVAGTHVGDAAFAKIKEIAEEASE